MATVTRHPNLISVTFRFKNPINGEKFFNWLIEQEVASLPTANDNYTLIITIVYHDNEVKISQKALEIEPE